MRGHRRILSLAVASVAAAAAVAAQAPAGEATVSDAPPASVREYETTFDFAAGGVFLDVDGNREKFRTERNLRSGFNTGTVFLDIRPVAGGGAFDFFNLSAFGFGDSSPYQRAALRLTKRKIYDFTGSYQKFNYFFGLPEFAVGLHPEDSVGRSFRFGLELLPSRIFSPILGYRRNQLYGTRFTSQDLGFDAYPVSYPRRLSSDEIFGGAKLKTRTASLRFIQSYIRFKDDQQLLPNGDDSVGFRGGTVSEGVRNVPARISTSTSRFLGAWRPSRRYDVMARYLYSSADLNVSRWEDLLIRIGQGQFPVRQLISSSGTSEKPTHNFGLSQSADLTERLSFHHRFVYEKYTLTGFLTTSGVVQLLDEILGASIDLPVEAAGGTITDYRLTRNEAELEFSVHRTFALFGSYRYRDRHMAFGPAGTTPRPVITIGHDGGGGIIWRPSAKGRLRATFEKGTASTAFNRIDPLSTMRWRIQGSLRPIGPLTITGTALIEDNRNDTPDVNYDLDNRQAGMQIVYVPAEGALISAGYNYLRLRTTTDIVFYALSQLTRGTSFYEANMHLLNSAVEVPIGDRVRFRVGYDFTRDTGESFPLTFDVTRAGVSVRLGRGVDFETDWRYYSYDERNAAIRNYNAHVLAVGLRFTSPEGRR